MWPAAETMRLNTLEVPVYWEQMEPERDGSTLLWWMRACAGAGA